MNTELTRDSQPDDTCGDYEWMVGPFLDGELPTGEVARLEGHLDGCARCQTLADQLRNLDDLARTSLAPPPRVSAREWGKMWEHIQANADTDDVNETGGLRGWVVPLLATAALLMLGLYIGMSMLGTAGIMPCRCAHRSAAFR